LRFALSVRAALVLATAVLLGGTLLAVPSGPTHAAAPQVTARAAGCKVPNCWMAVSFNTKTGYSGWTSDRGRSTKAAAMRAALERCRNRPENAGAVRFCSPPAAREVYRRNGCVAVYFRRRDDRIVEWAKGKADTPTPAKRAARRIVNDGPGEIVLSRVDCSARRF